MTRYAALFTLVILLAAFSFMFHTVAAQATSINGLRYPTYGTAGSLDPLEIQAGVSYQDAKPNFLLIVGMVDMDTPGGRVLPGIATSSPDYCFNQPTLQAVCAIKLQSTSGVEQIDFKIGGILSEPHGPGYWNLNFTAYMLNEANQVVLGSAASIPFRIFFTTLSLTVNVPGNVAVSVDGVQQPEGLVNIAVTAGRHNLTVPEVAYVDSSTRLRFDQWKDGFNKPNRTILVKENSTEYAALYVTQYRLSFSGDHPTASGDGWYDAGKTATFSVAEETSFTGIIGELGGKLRFQGWYEADKPLTTSTAGSILMDRPHELTVHWYAEIVTPVAVLAVVALAAMLFAYLLIRGRRARRGRTTRRGRRRVSASRKSSG